MKILLIILGVLLFLFVGVQIFFMQSSNTLETYAYQVDKTYDNFELRTYEESLFSSVKLPTKGYRSSSGKGFSILAGYIFGNNEKNEKISMTTPVTMSLEDSTTMMFLIPKQYSKESLPKPLDSKIEFKKVPEKRVAAIEFGGWASDKKIEEYKQKLIQELEKQEISHKGLFYFLGYNSPYEFMHRRNEIIVELE